MCEPEPFKYLSNLLALAGWRAGEPASRLPLERPQSDVQTRTFGKLTNQLCCSSNTRSRRIQSKQTNKQTNGRTKWLRLTNSRQQHQVSQEEEEANQHDAGGLFALLQLSPNSKRPTTYEGKHRPTRDQSSDTKGLPQGLCKAN